MREPVDITTQTRMFDPDAYVGVEHVRAALAEAPGWRVERYETRTRPPGAASTQHVDDVILCARRRQA